MTMIVLFGSALGGFTQRLVDWIFEEGGCDEALHSEDWIGYGEALFSGEKPIEEYQNLLETIEAFTRSKTKAELEATARERKLVIAPISTIAEVTEMEQFRVRDFWRELESPAGPLRYPGPYARFSQSPMQKGRRAPRLGEHNAEIYGELGVGPERLATLQEEGVI